MTSSTQIPFNRPSVVGNEFDYIRQAIDDGQLSGDGRFTKRCEELIQKMTSSGSVHLTHSCTAALEMAAILCELQPDDEVIMPSFTFVSTANAVALRGAKPVFVDVEAENFNLDPSKIEQALSPQTKAIWPIHYAGVVAQMDGVLEIARANKLRVVEDAAQALGSRREGKLAGSFGDMATFSFHETKNVISGEGGALTVNDPELTERAEIIREKGTNRRQFLKGMVDKYSWVDIGSSYLPGELVAAFLCAQLEQAESILERRIRAWNTYYQAFGEFESREIVQRMKIPDECQHNAHMFYILLPSLAARDAFTLKLREQGVTAPFHYVPLHNSIQGQKCSKFVGDMSVTNSVSERLVRLPLYYSIGEDVERVTSAATKALRAIFG